MLAITDILTAKICPHSQSWVNKTLIRMMLLLFRRHILQIHGINRLLQTKDPYIVILNHNQYLEAILIPILLIWIRQGRPLRFLADWNFMMIPILSSFYRRAQIIPITQKQARPQFLNAFKKYLVNDNHGFSLAKQVLMQGESIGIFPEGTTNRHPNILLRGQRGAAKLSIETGVPVLPIGIQFPHHQMDTPITMFESMELFIGELMIPPKRVEYSNSNEIIQWHHSLMKTLATLSNKQWHPHNPGVKLC